MLKESISKGMLQFGSGAFKTVGDTSASLIILDHISYLRTMKKQKHELTPWMAPQQQKEGRGEWGRKKKKNNKLVRFLRLPSVAH